MADLSPASFRRTRIAPAALPPGAVLIDQTRERTSWAEGMFVTSAHFNRDQSYVVARQGDLGRAIGAGVIDGLEVAIAADDPTSVIVEPGLGIGGGGESIVLHASIRIGLADIALQRTLTQGAGLLDSLQLISEARSGLFVLCATPVEYTSNPIGSYATGPDGKRRLQDSLITEATLFTLVPFALTASSESPEARRAMAARRIFLDGATAELPPSALPLAMVELDGNIPIWLDMEMVRRQAGAARADAFGLGFVDTPTRIAHFRQYDAQVTQMVTSAPNVGFAAASRFDILPPMGRMPAACVVPRSPAPGQPHVLSHNWLPAEMPVELTALPEDEIDQLLEESLTMPVIDLSAPSRALAQTPVTIIVPIPRADWASAPLEVVQQTRTLAAAAPLGAAPTTPMELITALLEQSVDPDLVDPTADAPWLALLLGRTTLWYARRRQFLRTDALTGEASPYRPAPEAPQPEPQPEPEPEPGPANPELAQGIAERFTGVIINNLIGWGLMEITDAVRPPQDENWAMTWARLNSALGLALRADSATVATDLLQRAAKIGAIKLADAEALETLYSGFDIENRFAPMEGFLTGGPVDIVIPSYPGRTGEIAVSAALALALNQRIEPKPGQHIPAVTTDMDERVKEMLSSLSLDASVIESIVNRGGGSIPFVDPRDMDTRVRAMKAAIEFKVPIIARPLERGSIEAQTRRNLLSNTDLVPDLAKRLDSSGLADRLDGFVRHMEVMDQALATSAPQAIDAATQSVKQIIDG
ncbi:hypothetical protein [Microvirga pakistanensis]|uniref:hypothetical protein n=1 Tax=Microvirga pakistanensis TaxID=1682650 RepID=UPI001069F240|nr:hypothetical protein [Microvirga pakistanensis]